MAAIAVSPFVLKDCTLAVGTDNYEAHVSQVQFNPSSSQVNWKGMTPASVFSDVTTATWVCALAYAQDWVTPNSLSLYLHAHEGEAIDVVFKPKAGTGQPSVEATLLITPGAIGGTVDQVATASVTLGVRGKPEIVPAV